MLFLLGLVPCLPLFWCVFRLARGRDPERRGGRLDRLARGVGWLAVCTLPAIVFQSVLMIAGGTSSSFDAGDVLGSVSFQWWVHLGGYSVQSVFEETAKAVTGHRQATMIDNWHYYVGLTAVQTVVLGAVAALRQGRGRSFLREPLALGIGVAVLVNGCLGATWPWWGS